VASGTICNYQTYPKSDHLQSINIKLLFFARMQKNFCLQNYSSLVEVNWQENTDCPRLIHKKTENCWSTKNVFCFNKNKPSL